MSLASSRSPTSAVSAACGAGRTSSALRLRRCWSSWSPPRRSQRRARPATAASVPAGRTQRHRGPRPLGEHLERHLPAHRETLRQLAATNGRYGLVCSPTSRTGAAAGDAGGSLEPYARFFTLPPRSRWLPAGVPDSTRGRTPSPAGRASPAGLGLALRIMQAAPETPGVVLVSDLTTTRATSRGSPASRSRTGTWASRCALSRSTPRRTTAALRSAFSTGPRRCSRRSFRVSAQRPSARARRSGAPRRARRADRARARGSTSSGRRGSSWGRA